MTTFTLQTEPMNCEIYFNPVTRQTLEMTTLFDSRSTATSLCVVYPQDLLDYDSPQFYAFRST